MGPAGQKPGDARAELAATEAEQERVEMALRAGWVIRRDPVRLEFAAGRDLHTARTLSELLDAIETADYGD